VQGRRDSQIEIDLMNRRRCRTMMLYGLSLFVDWWTMWLTMRLTMKILFWVSD